MESTSPSRSVFLAEPLTGVDQTLDRLLTIEIIVSLAAVAAVLGIGAWLISLTLRPLTQIERAASEIAAGNLSRRVDGARERDEVGRLAIAFNVMIERIEHLFAEQSSSASVLRQFVADASHELRTPLTAVRAYAELFERGAKDHPEDLERAMQGIQRESGRMSVLVDDLLLLARLDQHPETVWQEIDLTEIARNAIDAARIIEPQRTVTYSGENAVVIQGDPEALRRAIDNLLTNVRMHTPARTTAQVSITRDAEGALICVRDNGPGMSDELRSQAFARFTRGDTSRSREAGGAGLGLAIVAAIADVHSGTVAVAEATDTGTAITIRIPVTQKTHSRT
jgi:two-component system OmpR family sensor kinase